MTHSTDLIVFWVVVAARLLLPLGIPRFPLPVILACLVLDSADQSIFQAFTNLNLDGYQSYDKALDIYYLSIAFISTFRNWQSFAAFGVDRFLYFYRLAGAVAFELSQVRALLLVFPNTFEYFFIFYELVRARWNPTRLSTKAWIAAAAAIWIFIKLPQEWWIHVAQLDVTDAIKTSIFGVAIDTPWGEAIAAKPWVPVVALVVLALLVTALWWVVTRKLPAADWKLKLAADPLPSAIQDRGTRMAREAGSPLWNTALLEKTVMVSFVTVIFAQILPEVRSTSLQIVIGVAAIIVVNALLSHWLARRGRGWTSTLLEFGAMAAVNLGIVFLFDFLLPRAGGSLDLGNTLFFVLLLTLLVTLYDTYRVVYDVRKTGQAAGRTPAQAA